MSDRATVSDRANTVRQNCLSTLHTLVQKGSDFQLPPPPSALELVRQKLEENTYQLLVVGEAKRGKSTFVNALIGKDLLPTDVDIATSQVFRIASAEREAYRLRFEDDSQQPVTAGDLPRYGSQVMVNVQGVPRLDQMIRWIEVDVPVAGFLPHNVRILDTPGLGALYAAHAQITYRFVPHADAVIYVLDSQAPISEPDVKFIEQLLSVTRNILFIQTKIDQFRKEAWQEIQKRNEEILKARFMDRLADFRVWPISSTNLRKAAQTGDDDYLIVSRHKELAAALQAFLFRVAGWSRSVESVLAAHYYQTLAHKLLTDRLAELMEESKQKQAVTQQVARQCRDAFEADWSERGQKRRDLLAGIQKEINLGRQRIRQAFQPSGELDLQFRARIDALADINQAEQFAKGLPQDLLSATLAMWCEVRQTTTAKCTEAVGELAAAVINASLSGTDEAIRMPLGAGSTIQLNTGNAEKWLKNLRNATFAGTAAHFLVGATLTLSGPVWLIPAVAFLAVGIPTAIVEKRQQLKAAKQDLQRHLVEVLQRVRNRFLVDVDQTSGRFCLVDEYFNALDRALGDQIKTLASQKSDEMQAEYARLTNEGKLDAQERRAKAEQVRQQLADWEGIGRSIKRSQAELEELDNTWSAAPSKS